MRNPSGRRTIIRNDFTSSSINATPGGATAVRREATIGISAKPTTKRSAKGRIKSSTVAIYASVFVLIVSVIAVGYRAPQESASTVAATPVANAAPNADQPAVNAVVASDIAASVAAATSLAVAPNAAELAVSTRVQSEYAGATDNSTITKPVIVQLSVGSRQINSYAVQPGDTVASLAAKFGISESTIRWSNNLKDSDSIAAGSNIDVLPVTGIAYTVQDGDTVEKIAEKYKANVAAIITFNDLELQGITSGLKIIIPNGELPSTERPGYVAPRTYTAGSSTGGYVVGYGAGFGGQTWAIKTGTPMYAGNKYAAGNCTAYAYDRRVEMGRPVGGMWGNASSWSYLAASAGYTVNRTPAVGAVMQNGGGYGHVAIVEKVLPNGDIEISEMNAYVSGGGYNRVSGRIVSASLVGQYVYIH